MEFFNRKGKPITIEEWNEKFSSDYRKVASDEFHINGERVLVSTVWLGMPHFTNDSETICIFETMIFGGVHKRYMKRYPTIRQAINGHKHIVAAIKNGDPMPFESDNIIQGFLNLLNDESGEEWKNNEEDK